MNMIITSSPLTVIATLIHTVFQACGEVRQKYTVSSAIGFPLESTLWPTQQLPSLLE